MKKMKKRTSSQHLSTAMKALVDRWTIKLLSTATSQLLTDPIFQQLQVFWKPEFSSDCRQL
ncbi:hypothetical protein Taro_033674, partial [Colocasia esculenta]|nr:hypothetical protein [Colocasia esculenta]